MSDSSTKTETQAEEKWQGRFYALVLHPKREALLVRDAESPRLPEHQIEDDWMWAGRAARWGAKEFGLAGEGEAAATDAEVGSEDAPSPMSLGYRRWSARERDEEARSVEVAVVFDADVRVAASDDSSATADDVPAHQGWRWAKADDPVWEALPDFEAGAARAFLAERAAGAHIPNRQPWAVERSSWHAEVLTWIDAQLAARGRRRDGPLEIVKSWSISFVAAAPTPQGKVYFKASGAQPLFVNEAAFARAFAEHFPDLSPEIVALDEASGWLLLEDFGDPVGYDDDIDEADRRETRIQIIRLQARLQRRAAELGSEALLAAGCLDRRLPVVLEQIQPLIDDDLTKEALEEEELDRLRALAPGIVAALRECSALGLPDTLVHGDLHLGNVAQRKAGEGWVIFDWTDACLAHPFTDLIGIRSERDEELQAALREAYFEEWADILPADAVERAWALGGVAFHLHHAISYQHICNNVEGNLRGELWSMLPMHLRKLMEVVEGLAG